MIIFDLKSRLLNRWFWIGILAVIIMALQIFGVIVPPEAITQYTNFIDVVLVALGFAGIGNNPTDGKGLGDNPEKLLEKVLQTKMDGLLGTVEVQNTKEP